MKINKCYFILSLSLILVYSCSNSHKEIITEINTGKTLKDQTAGVACAHPAAAKIGAEILKKGGNAVDAAIAVQWALAVCYPMAGNIGGGGFMVVRTSDGNVSSLDYREKAPKGSSEDMYLDSSGNVISGLSLDSHLSVGVPGTVAGLHEAHKKYGSLPMVDLIKPAIELARNGFVLGNVQASNIGHFQNEFSVRNDIDMPFILIGKPQEGDTIKQILLAETLERISKNGTQEFYSGNTANFIIEEMQEGSGLISRQDLLDYEAKWREPIVFNWKNLRVISMGPPSSGGIILAQILKMLELSDIQKTEHNSKKYIHLINELERLVYADRSMHLGDPDFVNVPLSEILSEAYLNQRFDLINDSMATRSYLIGPGELKAKESTETTHLSVVDSKGNAVSVTTTLNGAYGSKIMVDRAGFFLNNQMDDFNAKSGVANSYGLVGSEANAIAPEKRMLSSMTPTIVEKDGALLLVLGSPGGSTIPTNTLQVLLNTCVYRMSLDSALKQPRFHHQWLPDSLYVEENRFDSILLNELKAIGHNLAERRPLGLVDAIMVNEDGNLEICGDPRSDNSAGGYKD